MISINNNNIFLQPTFRGKYTQKSLNANMIDSYYDSSSAATAYGKALVVKPKDDYTELAEKINNTSDSDTISIEDAAQEFSTIKSTDKRKTDLILACAYETDKPDVIINKKALLLLKQTIMRSGNVPKIEDVIRTCLDENNQTFNSDKFDNMFNAKGQVKLSARLKPRPQNYTKELREAKAQRRIQIQNAVENTQTEKSDVCFKPSDFFTPIDEQRKSIIADLDKIDNVPDDLRESIYKSLYQNDFDIRKNYSDYYSLLNECETLSDVKEFYPELEYPTEQPVYNKSNSYRSLSNRLANENFDKVVIDVLRKGYVELKPKNDMYINLENSTPTTYKAMQNSGYKISMPSQEMLNLMKKGDEITAKYSNVPKLDENGIKEIATKQAIRKSNVWGDYSEMTRTTWMPVRLIKNKRVNPEKSQYKTKNMVNAYLFNLYNFNKNANYPANPLEQYDDKNYLSKQMKGVVNGAYWTRFKKRDENINDIGFIDFQSKFDKEAIGKSFEHLENNYTKAFFSQYWKPERIGNLKESMQNAYDMIYEKILLNEQITPKTVTNEDVKNLIEDDLSMDITPNVDENQLSELRYISTTIKNQDLKERCMSCISNPDIVDLGYFDSVYKIIEKSKTDDGLNEDKALVLINLHDKYLSQTMNSDSVQSEDEFVGNYLEKYEQEDGEYDYKQAITDSNAEAKYYNSAAKLTTKGEDELNTLIEDKFIMGSNPDYNSANSVIEMYESIPDTFKNKFVASLKNKSKIRNDILVKELGNLQEKIASWNYDNDEVIIMDKERIPQKVIITHNAKKELWDSTGENMELFDNYLNKFYSAAQNRTGDKGGQGIKTVVGSSYDAEIKIMGSGGGMRMYTRPLTEEDSKYNNDGINVKYVFDTCDSHL